jgi:geranylgeranyl diphosphate synthase type I
LFISGCGGRPVDGAEHAHPLHIGGALAGAPGHLMRAFTAYGLPLGEAFQLRDDLLGLFGDPDETGKANLDDVRGRRPTGRGFV